MDKILPNLCTLASSLRNGTPCKPFQAQSVGGTFNAVAFLRFEDGVEWVARAPAKATSSGSLLSNENIDRFASEILTMRWLRENTSVKVPELYVWNIPETHENSTSNMASQPGSLSAADMVPWMMMEKLHGVSLTHEMWEKLNDKERQKVLAQVVDLYMELLRQPFSKLGSLHSQSPPSTNIQPQIYRYSFPPAPVLPPDRLSLTATYRSSLDSVQDARIRDTISDLHRTVLGSLNSSSTYFLAHPDLNPNNIIFDPQTLSISGFIDWDCTHTVSMPEFCIHPWFIQDRWYVDWDSEGLTRNQRDRDWFTEYIRMKTPRLGDSVLRVDEIADMFEQSAGVYLLGQFLHDTVCKDSELLLAMYSKLQPVVLEYIWS